MSDRFLLRKICDHMSDSRLPISLAMSLTWRHKLLEALRRAIRTTLYGNVEADEAFLRVSFKGRQEDLGQPPHKRGMAAGKHGISDRLVYISASVDQTGGCYLKPVTPGQMRIADFENSLAQRIDWENTTFLTDGHKSCTLPEVAQITRIRVKGHDVGSHHITNVNSCHYRIKEFCGGATKYLDHCLAFWQWLDRDRTEAVQETGA